MNSWQLLTDMTSMNDVNSEMAKKYKDTWLQIKSEDEISYGLFHGNYEDNSYVLKVWSPEYKEWNQIVYLFDHPDYQSFTIPKPAYGCYTSKNLTQAVIFSQLPHRQWKRGLCKQNHYAKTVVGSSNSFNEAVLNILMPMESMTISEALKVMDEQELKSIALNRNFIISLNFSSKNDTFLLLLYHNYIIGKVLRGKKQIQIENPIFLQEVLDTKHNWCPDYEVIIHE